MSVPRAIVIVRAVEFSSGLRYFDSNLSDAENRALYGSLYREKGLGANFRLEAHFSGPVDPLTGMIINLIEIDRWLGELTSRFDGRFLNELGEVFGAKAPTPERLARHFFDELGRRVQSEGPPGARLAKVRLCEGETLWVDCSN